MLRRRFGKCVLALTAVASVMAVPSAFAEGATTVLFGKNGWLFTPYEFAMPADSADTQTSIQMFANINKLFERKGIALALAIVPSKIRIHADQLPDNKPLDSYTNEKYDNAVKALTAAGVNVVDLNQAFLKSPLRTGDTPIFLRQDTHWSPPGAMLAAETIKATIDATPTLKAALGKIPEAGHSMAWAPKKSITRARDLVRYLPQAEQGAFAPEQTLNFKVTRTAAAQASLQGEGNNVGILVIGSSYTNKGTGYPDALRFTLQRDLLDISLNVDFGPWYGMESYLKDDAFKTNPPKLIIWEVPERELRSPPNSKFREARYQFDNNDWLAKVTALLK